MCQLMNRPTKGYVVAQSKAGWRGEERERRERERRRERETCIPSAASLITHTFSLYDFPALTFLFRRPALLYRRARL